MSKPAYAALSDYFNRDALLERVRTDAELRKEGGQTQAVLSRVVLKHLRAAVIAAAKDEIAEKLKRPIDNYKLINGDGDDPETRDDWESGLDDVVEAEIEPYVETLSQDWLGAHTVDSGVGDEEGFNSFCKSFANELWKQLTYGKTPADVLKAAEIDAAEIKSVAPTAKKGTPQMTTNTLEAVVRKIVAHCGSIEAVPDGIVDMAADEELILAQHGLNTLGLDESDHSILVNASLVHGDDLESEIANIAAQLDASPESGDSAPAPASGGSAPAKVESDKPAPPKPAKGRAKTVSPNAPGALPQIVATALKDHSALTDTEAGSLVGCSRTTFNALTKGKKVIEVNDAQRQAIRERLVGDVNGLLEALAALDNAQPMRVE